MSAEPMPGSLEAELDAFFQQYTTTRQAPGLAYGLTTAEGLVHSAGFGVANADGLESESGTTFTQTYESGNYQLRTAGDGKAGEIEASSLESSTVELTDEFSRMIVAQQAYSAASKVMTTAQDMIDTLISMKR